MSVIKIGEEEFEEVPKGAVAASKILADMKIRLGSPQTPLSDSGQKLMNVIIAVWEDLYPLEAKAWYEDRKEYQKNEMSLTEQVRKHTGRSLASYPYPIYQMMKKLFPTFNATERKNCMKMVKKYQMFKMANKV